MTLTKKAGKTYPETIRVDAVAALEPVEPVPVARRSNGTLATAEAARALGARGGRAKRAKDRFVEGAGVAATLGASQAQAWEGAVAYAQAQAQALGPPVSPAVHALLVVAGLQLHGSHVLFAAALKSGAPVDFVAASRLGDASRNNVLSALELHAREAGRRAEGGGGDGNPLVALALANIRASEAAAADRHEENDDEKKEAP